MEDLIEETLTGIKGPLEEKRVTVRRELHPNLPAIEADRDQIKQVLLNLFHNAIEAMNNGDTLHILAFALPREQEPGVAVKVVDQGRGIPASDLPHVFEPFYTTGKSRGTGLGLAICRNIVDAHRGDLSISSEPGTGTTVRLWLPLRQSSQTVAA
jgi:signal transduction histidine kinase